MQKLFLGLVFIFLNFSISFGSCKIGLIPDFVGYALLARGLHELQDFSPRFAHARPMASGMAVFSAALYALDLLGSGYGVPAQLLGIVAVLLSLYVSYQVVCGVGDLQAGLGADLGADALRGDWVLLAVLQLLGYLFLISALLGTVVSLATLGASILFLVSFWRCKCRYDELQG